MLNGKRIVVGISGGIAAYKTIELIRLLRKQNAEVRVVLTPAASHFVTPLTLQAISGNPVADSLLDPQAELAMGHIELAKWADIIVIAPASADLLARLNVGMANDLLTTICLATSASILLAPAMNQQMYAQSIVQQNLQGLQARGYNIIGPNSGEQACGDIGKGRMSEPVEIYAEIEKLLSTEKTENNTVTQCVLPNNSKIDRTFIQNCHIVITAGPTREAIDPVRYISNHSSGKMGFAIAEAFARLGAKVTLLSGPVNLATPANVERINVTSALEMWQAAMGVAKQCTIFIGCAAVADYRVEQVATQKIKKSDEHIQLHLVKNPDIIADIAQLAERPFVVGFAAETQAVAEYAQDKLRRKKLDMICANDVSSSQQGFNSDQNALHIFWQEGAIKLPLMDKGLLANQLAEIIIQRYTTTYLN